MKRLTLFLIAVFTLLFCFAEPKQEQDLDRLFKSPPESTKPGVFWYWLNGYISQEGVIKDLEAMQKVGIGEALIGTVKFRAIDLGKSPVLSPEWWNCTELALKKADSLGIKIGLFNCPGWSLAGGPWVLPEHAMRYMSTSEFHVKGPKRLVLKFPEDTTEQLVNQTFLSDAYVFDKSKTKFQQIIIQAFPKPVADNESINNNIKSVICSPNISNIGDLFDNDESTKVSFTGKSFTITIELKERQVIRSLQLLPVDIPMNAHCELQYMDNAGDWNTIINRRIERQNILLMTGCLPFSPIVNGFEEISAEKIRIILTNKANLTNQPVLGCLSDIRLSGAERLSFYPEKQLNKISLFDNLSESYLKNDSKYSENKDLVVNPEEIVDITSLVNENNELVWDVPEGEWVIQRSGLLPTGTHNHPTTEEGRGFEVDKMNKEYVRSHFDSYIGEILRRIPVENRKTLKSVFVDSYEQGPQNWTEGFEEEFVKAYGYSPFKWLPVLRGRIVSSPGQSERFLWDIRRLVADMIAKNFTATLQQCSKENGLRLRMENYGHYGFPAEFLSFGKNADDITGEFWFNRSSTRDSNLPECRAATSAASIYGKQIVSAESFTSTDLHKNTPRDLKRKGDWAFAQGINHIILHLYIHQPDDRKPGMNAWYGTDFNRNSTWFFHSKPFIDYLKRSTALLQQGKRVIDVAYFIGEDTPIGGGKQHVLLPSGFDYDYINADVIKNSATVKDNVLALNSGATYRVLVLPDSKTMRPEVLSRIEQLVSEGMIVLGNKPESSPSLKDYPKADIEVNQLASKMWGGLDGKTKFYKDYGKGRIFSGVELSEVFNIINLSADVDMPANYVFTHRKTSRSDIYFISNQLEQKRNNTLGFRISGKQPELFDAITGETRLLSEFDQKNGMTYIPLQFESAGSFFIIFRKNIHSISGGDNFHSPTQVLEIKGSWEVSFDSALGAPQNVKFSTLSDWTKSSNSAIKYYSGTATYQNEFVFEEKMSDTYLLDLGKVETIAIVRLNGKDVGTLWCHPYTVNISGALKKGKNKLEIDVVNPWWNRLIGDKQINKQPYTWTSYSNWNEKSQLLPAGLLGPVVVKKL